MVGRAEAVGASRRAVGALEERVRIGIAASNPLEWLALRSGRAPRPLGDVWLAVFQARAVMAGVRLGVFEALADAAVPPAAVAAATDLRPDMVEMLLRLLACTPYVRSRRDGFALTRAGRRFMTRDGAASVAGLMELQYFNLEWLGELEAVLRSGRGVDMHARLQGGAAWDVYQRAMRDAARLQAPLVARHVGLPRKAQRLLDLGGSHGIFAAALCRRHPGLRAEVLDLPAALASARRLAIEAGHADVVQHRAGDVLVSDLGSNWDGVFIGNLLHHLQPDQIIALLRRVHAACSAGARLAIWELERPRRDRPPSLIGDGMALLFRVTSGASVYAAADYVDWLRDSGWCAPRARRMLAAPGQVLITARR
jgi:hypothetical protein